MKQGMKCHPCTEYWAWRQSPESFHSHDNLLDSRRLHPAFITQAGTQIQTTCTFPYHRYLLRYRHTTHICKLTHYTPKSLCRALQLQHHSTSFRNDQPSKPSALAERCQPSREGVGTCWGAEEDGGLHHWDWLTTWAGPPTPKRKKSKVSSLSQGRVISETTLGHHFQKCPSRSAETINSLKWLSRPLMPY